MCLTIQTRGWMVMVAVAVLAATSAFAAEEIRLVEESLSAEELVEQLGDPAYAKRQRARDELERRSFAVQAALEGGLTNQDLEIRYHCEQLLVDIQEAATRRQLEEFVRQTDKTKEYDFPGWKDLREAVGDSQQSRQLYVAMYQQEGELLKAAASSPGTIGNDLLTRVQRAQRGLHQWQSPSSLGHISAWMLVAGMEEAKVSSNATLMIFSFCHQPVFRENLNSSASGPVLRKLLGRLIERTEETNSAYTALTLSMQFDMKEEGLTLAKRLLGNKAAASHIKQYAVLALAKMGTSEDAPLIEALLDDKTIVSQMKINKADYQTQIRDVALFSLIHITGQDPKSFGFDRYSPNPQLLVAVHTLGFENDTKRQAAFDQWKKQQEK